MKRLVIPFLMLLCSAAAFAGEPCCGIKSIDLRTGVVKAVDTRSSKVFEFTVTNATLLRSLKVGDAINADFAKNIVTLKAEERIPLRLAPFSPCCGIRSIDLKTGIVKAAPHQPPDGARVFEFTVTNATLLRSLKVGDAINADFATNFVTLKAGERFPLRLAPNR
ncbi:MAG: copper-binding protein [Acidobacteriota bacterium]|nr:copper-binding protein [Acidobacteriota bacterium]